MLEIQATLVLVVAEAVAEESIVVVIISQAVAETVAVDQVVARAALAGVNNITLRLEP
jgi:hypothetical protein